MGCGILANYSSKSFNDDENILKLIDPVRNPSKTGNYRIRNIDRFVKDLELDGVKLNLNPEFQRGRVWNTDQQTKFMENVIRGLVSHETNIIRLNDPTLARMNNNFYSDLSDLATETICIDGLQRFTAMQMYMQKELKPFGLSFDEIESTYYGVIAKGITFTVSWYDFQFEADIIEFYEALNWGGTPHSENERIRIQPLKENAIKRKNEIFNRK